MPKVEKVVNKIRNREGFEVCFRYPNNGRKVRKDKQLPVQYPSGNRAPNTQTVAGWRRNRFHQTFPNFNVDVLDGNGMPVAGGIHLRRVRATYVED
jgi:hypothetical protein